MSSRIDKAVVSDRAGSPVKNRSARQTPTDLLTPPAEGAFDVGGRPRHFHEANDPCCESAAGAWSAPAVRAGTLKRARKRGPGGRCPAGRGAVISTVADITGRRASSTPPAQAVLESSGRPGHLTRGERAMLRSSRDCLVG